ncbi:hypothetical protein Tco_1085678 [Tanacetum coccineum]
MAMVARGHGGDNGPSNDDRPCEPPSIHMNAKGRKKGFDAKLLKKLEDGLKKKISIDFDLTDQKTAKPVGVNNRDFTSLIGNQIQRSIPFCYELWEAVPEKNKRTLWPAIHAYFDMAPYLSRPNAKQVEKGMKAQFKSQYKNRKNKFKDEMFMGRGGYKELAKIQNFLSGGKRPQSSTQGSRSYATSRHKEITRFQFGFITVLSAYGCFWYASFQANVNVKSISMLFGFMSASKAEHGRSETRPDQKTEPA